MEGKELVEIIPIGRENAIRSEDLARLVGAKGIFNNYFIGDFYNRVS